MPYRIVVLQLVATIAAATGWLMVDGSQAFAALLAGVTCVLPGAYFAWRATVERSPGKLLGQGVLKFALTVVLLAVCIGVFEPAAAGFFGTFVLLQTMYVVGPLLPAKQLRER